MSRSPRDEILQLQHRECVTLTNAQKEELERRWQSLEQDSDEGEPWEDFKRSLLAE